MSDSDSSEDEDLSRFKDVVDVTFTKLIDESRGLVSEHKDEPKPKSERYLEEASHYNDVKVPAEMQKRIGAKMSAVINKNVEFIDVQQNGIKKHKIKGGVKLFKDSKGFLSCEEVKDTYTEIHNKESKKMLKKRKIEDELDESEKISGVAVSGEYVLSKEETKLWKSRRKEKLFKYKSKGKSKVLTAIE
ncbi:uncharacterized protein LOC126375945 [Pectinophora gossypiella]|uniref:uncharacterized protein LOC126375945 n=1 Tax=Pectinophora gossypiella TaxID=13191 RepID=UPI00214EE5E1|nr:uncharacterized protein LOC126375945 [Pectinophora gossypiella]